MRQQHGFRNVRNGGTGVRFSPRGESSVINAVDQCALRIQVSLLFNPIFIIRSSCVCLISLILLFAGYAFTSCLEFLDVGSLCFPPK